VFNGRVLVAPDAQHTDSDQSNRNVLLSEGARVDTKPELEIYADDVICAHGTTVGQLEDEAIFYLRSRGIPKASAERMLTGAFVQELVDTVRCESLRTWLDNAVQTRLAAMHEGRA
jgi:Fe-S cluster assembly protein SufD